MSYEVKVPDLGESITQAMVLEWLVAEGDFVSADQDLVTLETDKVTVNVPSPVSGQVTKHLVAVDGEIEVGASIAVVDESAKAAAGAAPSAAAPAEASTPAASDHGMDLMPAVKRLVDEHGLDPRKITGTGRGGRILKEDVLAFMKGGSPAPAPAPAPAAPAAAPAATRSVHETAAREEIVPMSSLRRKIAERLVAAQQNAAMLTTFNEIDMSAVMALRKQYKEKFADKYGIKLGFTSFFAKAVIEGLKAFPGINAEIRGTDIVYKNYYDIGVAVGGGRGLVVPVVRDADRLSFAGFELALADLAKKAKSNRLTLEEMTGGTFTISNGGVYGSLLSTPILNPPQSGILGLHKIEKRPVAIGDQVVVRPMMYVALSYDHRIVDGREAVSFLVKVKECIEDPNRVLLEV